MASSRLVAARAAVAVSARAASAAARSRRLVVTPAVHVPVQRAILNARSFCAPSRAALRPSVRDVAPAPSGGGVDVFDSQTRLVFLARPPVVTASTDTGADGDGDEGILVLTLNRPQAANAISTVLLAQLHEVLDYLRTAAAGQGTTPSLPGSTAQPPPPRVLILRSAVPRVFCAGADLKERARMTSTAQIDAFLLSLRHALRALERLGCPVLAALDGLAMGGGLELALCADVRVAAAAAAPAGVRLGLTETKLGIIPGAGGTQRLSRLVGLSRAKDLIFSGRVIDGPRALEYGLVDHLAPASEGQETAEPAFARALELAREMSRNGPLALRAAKLAIDKGFQMDLETGLDFERECYERLFGTEDRLEGLRAFQEKRRPRYIGR